MKVLFISPGREVLKNINHIPREGDVVFMWEKHYVVDRVVWLERSGEEMCEIYLSRNAYVSTLDE